MSILHFFFGGQMGFHELAIFPETISIGSSGGPRFNTQVVKLDGGGEHRLPRWTEPIRAYNVRGGIKTQADAYSVLEFFYARLGATYGFRYKDWNDYATTVTGTVYRSSDAALAFDDHQLVIHNPGNAEHGLPAVGNGLRKQFQLAKHYVSGGIDRVRNIQKPKGSTVLIGHNGVQQTTGWTLDDVSGVLTFTFAPGVGVVTWGGEFYVPCRFTTDTDQSGLVAQAEDFDNFTNPNVGIEEIKSGLSVPEERHRGGAKDWGLQAQTISIQVGQGSLQRVDPTAIIDVLLPDADTLPPGIGYFHLHNDSLLANGWNLLVKTPGGALLATVVGKKALMIDLILDGSGIITWVALGN